MEPKLLIHLDLDEKKRVTRALGNIENFLETVPAEESSIRVVTNSSGVDFFRKEQAGDYKDKIEKLSNKGVKFLICKNTLSKKGIDPSELLEVCEVIPAGIVTLVQLQKEGYAYVKP
jgi:uncharacterized protein